MPEKGFEGRRVHQVNYQKSNPGRRKGHWKGRVTKTESGVREVMGDSRRLGRGGQAGEWQELALESSVCAIQMSVCQLRSLYFVLSRDGILCV